MIMVVDDLLIEGNTGGTQGVIRPSPGYTVVTFPLDIFIHPLIIAYDFVGFALNR